MLQDNKKWFKLMEDTASVIEKQGGRVSWVEKPFVELQ